MAKEVSTALYGECNAHMIAGPRVFGGMTMPVELIVERVIGGLRQVDPSRVPVEANMGAGTATEAAKEVSKEDVTRFMQNI